MLSSNKIKQKMKKFILKSKVYERTLGANIIFKELIYDLCMNFVPHNWKIRHLIQDVSAIDSIACYDKFCKRMIPHINCGKKLSFFFTGKEKYPYGYWMEILHYAGIKNVKYSVFSEMEHGIRFGTDDNWEYHYDEISYVFQGDYRYCEIERKDKYMAKYAIGPYILYARDYYTTDVINEIKKKNGKTLLVFPSHSWEFEEAKRDTNSLINIVYDKYSAFFDTILVCVYWNDIGARDIEEYKRRGAKLVSAGFREDANFVRRLKTIINLSDAVVGDDLGTNIGYCLALNKKFFLECSYNRYPDQSVYSYYLPRFKEAFESSNMTFSERQIDMQMELYKLFWGGNERVLVPKKMHDLIVTLYNECKLNKYSYRRIRINRQKK